MKHIIFTILSFVLLLAATRAGNNRVTIPVTRPAEAHAFLVHTHDAVGLLAVAERTIQGQHINNLPVKIVSVSVSFPLATVVMQNGALGARPWYFEYAHGAWVYLPGVTGGQGGDTVFNRAILRAQIQRVLVRYKLPPIGNEHLTKFVQKKETRTYRFTHHVRPPQ